MVLTEDERNVITTYRQAREQLEQGDIEVVFVAVPIDAGNLARLGGKDAVTQRAINATIGALAARG